MITSKQARRIFKMSQDSESQIDKIALKTDVDPKTVRKYLKARKMPDEIKPEHTWKTRKDPFEDDWQETEGMLSVHAGLEAKTIFGELQGRHPDKYSDGQLRTLQRKIKIWRALEGPGKEVFFAQIHRPGELSESDFTHMESLKITINKIPFAHLLYHFVLTYSNWETGGICHNESFESLSRGMQEALWELGGVTQKHRTDRLTTAVHNIGAEKGNFVKRYTELLNHYGLSGEKTQPESPNENGDVEQRHYRFKNSVEQELMLRGSSDFNGLEEYLLFLKQLFVKLNRGRQNKLQEELKCLAPLPQTRLETCKRLYLKVTPGSTIHVLHNTYSVHSRLIGENIMVKAQAEQIEIWYAQKCVDKIPRLSGEGGHKIDYRHIIDWLIRKPGAFENYRYREDMFPSTRFRIAYDSLKKDFPGTGHKKYLEILHLAANEGEDLVDNALRVLIEKEKGFNIEQIREILAQKTDLTPKQEVQVIIPDIKTYDELLREACYA